MPRKVFTAGEILTAADVNTNLMDQAVMVFDDSAARGSAIPSPSEGMVTYLKDTDAVEKFDGSNFVNVSPGGLVAVKSALKTDTFTASVGAGGNVAVTDLSITHEVSDPANRLIITAFFGAFGESSGFGRAGIAVSDGTNLLAIGDAAGSRNLATAIGRYNPTATASVTLSPSQTISFVHTPGAGSKTYSVNVVNGVGNTQTFYVNRSENDGDDAGTSRAASSLVIQEVAV